MSRYPNLENQLREFETQEYPTTNQTAINNALILYKRKKYFLDQLRQSFFFTGLILIVIVYLKDISFARFVMRGMIHYALSNPYAQMTGSIITEEIKKVMGKSLIVFVIFVNSLCLLVHLVFGAYTETKSPDGYLQGGLTVQFIGERLPYSLFELIIYDVLIFGVQLVYHCLQCSTDDSAVLAVKAVEVEEELEEGVDETAGADERFQAKNDIGDGYSGDVFLLSIDVFLDCLKALMHRGGMTYMDSFSFGQRPQESEPEVVPVVPITSNIPGPTVGAYVTE